jgi:hypothetical protein
MKCICAVVLHKTSVRGKRNTLETFDSSWIHDGGRGEERRGEERRGEERRVEERRDQKAEVCSLRGI